MTFDIVQFQATLRHIDIGLRQLDGQVKRIPQLAVAAAGHWYMTDSMSAAVLSAGNRLSNVGNTLLGKLNELMLGAAAPARFFFTAYDWGDVRGEATTVAGNLSPVALSVDHHWKGKAADAYAAVIKPQTDAAIRIGVIADKTVTALTWSAASGLAFYLAVGLILCRLIAAFATAIAAFCSAVFSWAGAALVIEEATVDAAMLVAAVSGLLVSLGMQATQLSSLHSEAADATAFPGRHWPSSATDRYSDATVTDADADWSVES